MNPTGLFQFERDQDVIVVTPRLDMGEFNCDQIKQAGSDLLALVDAAEEKDLAIDFSQSKYFGSDALGLFVHLWRKTNQRGGRIAFCGVSEYGGEILRRAKFDHIGLICTDRVEAIRALRQG